ncbi:MAG: c-type cytochrome [Chloroflexota bacterium]
MRGDSAAIVFALALVAFVLWLLIAQREKVRYPSKPAIVAGEFAMERKVQLVIALLVLTGLSLTLYGFGEPGRQAVAVSRQEDLAIERAISNYTLLCVSCHGVDGLGAIVPGSEPVRVAPPLNRADFRPKDPDEIKKQYDLIYKTIQRGRPNTPMPAWGQTDGGVLIPEHIHELVTLIMAGDKRIHGRTAWQIVEHEAENHIADGTLQRPEKLPEDPNAPPGQRVFTASGCGACHVLEGVPGAAGAVGPALNNIGNVAATRRPGASTEDYIRESIAAPNAFVVPGFAPVMPAGLVSNPSDLTALVEFLAGRRQ